MKDALDLIMELLGEEYDGDVDSPTGTFWRVSVNTEEVLHGSLRKHVNGANPYATQVADEQNFDWESLVGEWIVVHDSNGFTFPVKCGTAELADAAYAKLEAAYADYSDTDEN